MTKPGLIDVAVQGPMRRTFTYALPAETPPLSPGQRLLVPFGKARKVGFYLGPGRVDPSVVPRTIIRELDADSFFPPDLFSLCSWMADYYFANPADCLISALPPHLKSATPPRYRWIKPPAQLELAATRTQTRPGDYLTSKLLAQLRASGKLRALVRSGEIQEAWETPSTGRSRIEGYRAIPEADWEGAFHGSKTARSPFDGVRSRAELETLGWTQHSLRKAIKLQLVEPVTSDGGGVLDFIQGKPDVCSIRLTPEQDATYARIRDQLDSGFRTFLLHGITGSGKTIIYCHLAERVLEAGRTALILTPEIALSGATLAYFRGFFGDAVTVIHSAMTDRERLESWQGIRSGKFRIVVGPRSAVFAPLENLGLIVVDEEHDGSYKQDEPSPRFHGRDCAIMRAKHNKIPVLLGSASPSVESYYNARSGRYTLLELTQRPGAAVLPDVRVIDMRTQGTRGEISYLSIDLKRAVEQRLSRGDQVILFLNRRGYAPMLKCGACGHVPLCPQCRLRMTFHKAGRRLTCHYCGHSAGHYDACEKCGGAQLLLLGAGTQRVEETLPMLFPAAKAVRLDSDAVSARRSAHVILNDVAHHRFNLLLGTQMVTKGLDLPDVSLVGVLSADLGIDLPDFRSGEKTFARLLQVAGRSGRANKRGEVLIQTYSPESTVIQNAARQDYVSFYDQEIVSREAAQYPPFVRIINLLFSGPDDDQLRTHMADFGQQFAQRVSAAGIKLQLLGPAPCPLAMIRHQFRHHIILKTNQTVRLVKLLGEWESQVPRFGLPATVKIVVDVDPDDMM